MNPFLQPGQLQRRTTCFEQGREKGKKLLLDKKKERKETEMKGDGTTR